MSETILGYKLRYKPHPRHLSVPFRVAMRYQRRFYLQGNKGINSMRGFLKFPDIGLCLITRSGHYIPVRMGISY